MQLWSRSYFCAQRSCCPPLPPPLKGVLSRLEHRAWSRAGAGSAPLTPCSPMLDGTLLFLFSTSLLAVPPLTKVSGWPGPALCLEQDPRGHSGPVQTLGRTQYLQVPASPPPQESWRPWIPLMTESGWVPPKASCVSCLPVAFLNPCHLGTDEKALALRTQLFISQASGKWQGMGLVVKLGRGVWGVASGSKAGRGCSGSWQE